MGTFSETVVAVDAADGTKRWESFVGEDLVVAASDEAVYGWGFDTPLKALDASDGSGLWVRSDFEPGSPPALAGEYLFVGDTTGMIRAIGSPTE